MNLAIQALQPGNTDTSENQDKNIGLLWETCKNLGNQLPKIFLATHSAVWKPGIIFDDQSLLILFCFSHVLDRSSPK